jgi:hypothetical protein
LASIRRQVLGILLAAIINMKLVLLMLVIPIIGLSQESDTMASSFRIIEDFPDTEAEFPGGRSEMLMYLSTNMEYPPITQWECFRPTKIYLIFTIMADGSIEDVKVWGGISDSYHSAAIKVVENMPNWIPATKSGKTVNSSVRIPIQFEL